MKISGIIIKDREQPPCPILFGGYKVEDFN